ncbi:M20/M25/M40 family metallo-hydrolase [Streptomyces sp. NPDC019396]|uniref:M20/M25/M40 family metallo-hydrolase n=1 Tax=Streptomyces sp. NPDC019396 TaxID=3154687 RepID=UPI0033DC1D55
MTRADDPMTADSERALDEVVGLCRDMIRFDTSNHFDGSGPGERPAAEYVARRLDEVGIASTVLEAAPGRTSVVARIRGRDRSRPALLLHGHLDVVPADRHAWSVDPFAGEIRDDCLWGRGAVDMKNMNAMILAAVRRLARNGALPARDIVLAFLADEESGGALGSRWLVEHHRDLLEDCDQAVSEIGGFSVSVPGSPTGQRVYLVETARKGVAWLRLRARGTRGHGSMVTAENATVRLAAAVTRLGGHCWPLELTRTTTRMATELKGLTGIDIREDDLDATALAPVAGLIGSSLRHVANPTVLRAGDTVNVIPAHAEALVDGRFVPGRDEDFLRTVGSLVGPGIEMEVIDHTASAESDPDSSLIAAMHRALLAEDPAAAVVPYCSSASTDNASFAALGIEGFGFVPLRLPAGFDFARMFHGVDERIPLSSLRFGASALHRFLTDH